ncbi:hypothetical protein BgiMline_021005 [Biomphalaria glabrata]|nr:CAunnamed protein product [Biomphalaria glabrata]
MSLLLVKTKNLSWQDHTLNIEVMISPQGSTLLVNKHKALDAKFDKEKSIFEKQRAARLKDFLIERRFIQRQRMKLMRRSLELAEERAKSARIILEKSYSKQNDNRSSSAPVNPKRNGISSVAGSGIIPIPFPRIPLKSATLFAATLHQTNVYLDSDSEEDADTIFAQTKAAPNKPDSEISAGGVFLTAAKIKPIILTSQLQQPSLQNLRVQDEVISSDTATRLTLQPSPRMMKSPSIRFSDLTELQEPIFEVDIKKKSLEEKVKGFLKDQIDFNVRPPSLVISKAGRSSKTPPLVAQRYTTLTFDPKVVEKSFDQYCKHRTYEDLTKTMKLAAKMKCHVKQARNTSLIPSIATFKSTKSFLRLLKLKKRNESESTPEAEQIANN